MLRQVIRRLIIESVAKRPIDVLHDANLPYGPADDPRRKSKEARYSPTLDWTGMIPISAYENLPYQGDLKAKTYAGSKKEKGIEDSILNGTAFDDASELPIIEVEVGNAGISQGNHRTYSLRKLKAEGKIGDMMVPMRIIYYGNEDLNTSAWHPKITQPIQS